MNADHLETEMFGSEYRHCDFAIILKLCNFMCFHSSKCCLYKFPCSLYYSMTYSDIQYCLRQKPVLGMWEKNTKKPSKC